MNGARRSSLLRSLRLLLLPFCFVTLIDTGFIYARGYEGSRDDSILLNGQWEFTVGDGSEGSESGNEQNKLSWQRVTLPGPFMKWSKEAANDTKIVWARRSFSVSASQAEGLAVLRWNRIACGAAAFINGQKVGRNEPTGPFRVIFQRA
jgi:hypothetical protein